MCPLENRHWNQELQRVLLQLVLKNNFLDQWLDWCYDYMLSNPFITTLIFCAENQEINLMKLIYPWILYGIRLWLSLFMSKMVTPLLIIHMQTFWAPVGWLRGLQQLDNVIIVLIYRCTPPTADLHYTVNPLSVCLSVSGMYPVWFNVSKRQKGSSHWQESLLRWRECSHFSPWAGVFTQTQTTHEHMCVFSIF